MPELSSVCVFCGSNAGANPAYLEAAEAVGRGLAQRGIRVVYGGGKVGMMGAVADAARDAGGEVIGVIPQAIFDLEIGHTGLDDLRVVGSMHERKALMADLSDAFVALPGGFGTFEEFCEVITWTQLGLHRKRCGLLNVLGFYDRLLGFLDFAVGEAFMKPMHRNMLLVSETPERLLEKMESYRAPPKTRWIAREEC